MTSPYTEGFREYARLLGGEIRDRQTLPNVEVVEIDDVVDPCQHPHIDTVTASDASQGIAWFDDIDFTSWWRRVGSKRRRKAWSKHCVVT